MNSAGLGPPNDDSPVVAARRKHAGVLCVPRDRVHDVHVSLPIKARNENTDRYAPWESMERCMVQGRITC